VPNFIKEHVYAIRSSYIFHISHYNVVFEKKSHLPLLGAHPNQLALSLEFSPMWF
jgi:hypothetical protein